MLCKVTRFHKTYHIKGSVSLFTTQYIEELFMIGEAKSGVFNLLVTHVIETWTNHLEDGIHGNSHNISNNGSPNTTTLLSSSNEGSSSGPQVLAVTEAVVASMKAHVDLLLKAAAFGPIHKKNIRSVCYVCCDLHCLTNCCVFANFADDDTTLSSSLEVVFKG